MPAEIRALITRREHLLAQRRSWEPTWALLGEFLCPRKREIVTRPAPGQKQTERLFDSEGIRAPEILASSIDGTATPRSQKWFSLLLRDKALNDRKDVRDWLETVADQTHLALSQSNFYNTAAEVYLDLAVFGTGVSFQEEARLMMPGSFGGLRFTSLSPGEYAIAEGPEGVIDTLVRDFELSARAAVAMWDRQVGERIGKLAEEKPDELVTISHFVYPRADRKTDRANRRNKLFASTYFDVQGSHLIAESGFDEFPFAVPRWTKTSREIYGRGPGYTALPDIRSINRLAELTLVAGAKAVDPPLWQLHDGVRGETSLEPSAINYVTQKDALGTLEGRQRFDVAEFLFDRLERKIRQIFYVDLLLILRQKPNMTATEIAAIQEEMRRLLGPAAGRLLSEFLAPTIERAVKLQARAGALPPPPELLLQFGGDIDIQFEGPLARAQRAQDLEAINRKNAWLTSVVALKPEVLDLYDWDAEGREVAQIVGVPGNLVHSDDTVASLRTARAEAQARQARAADVAALAEAGGKVAPLVQALQPGQPEEVATR